MHRLLNCLQLRRTGAAEAEVGVISLPLPRELAGKVRVDHPACDMRPVAWWERHKVPRRVMVYVLNKGGVPETLRLIPTHVGTPGRAAAPVRLSSPSKPSSAWQVKLTPTIERETFKPVRYANIDSLRGVPADDCATAQAQLELTYAGRTLVLQAGATGPKGGPYYWESVQIDPLWDNSVAQGVRVGGVIYNEDTYLWADIYLVLLANGVIDVAAHFVNTKLHIKGYDFHGLPMLRLAGDAVQPAGAVLPRDGLRVNLGATKLNFEDASVLFSQEYPARLEALGPDVHFYPVARTFNAQVPEALPTEWPVGYARSVRFQMSLSDAPPLVARYAAPSWWYALSGEPWGGGYLPVQGDCDRLGEKLTDLVRGSLTRGQFDGASGSRSDSPSKIDAANDGDAGFGMMQNYYHTGRGDIFTDALHYCYFWADLMVDHADFTVRQWVGGWGWKTCAYTKFRDVLFGYLETGDPYLLDTAEMSAEAHWAWYRSNWPRCSIGRDNFELGAWAMLWGFFDSQHARERTLELIRMSSLVLSSRGQIGGQMGAGPHPGYFSSLYMTGVTMISLCEAGAVAVEKGERAVIEAIIPAMKTLHQQFMRDDVEQFPSNKGHGRDKWGLGNHRMWAIVALRVYPELARFQGGDDEVTLSGLLKARSYTDSPPRTWPDGGRLVMFYANPLHADAMLLGAKLEGEGVSLSPVGPTSLWPAEQIVRTPYGDLVVRTEISDGRAAMRFQAEREFPVIVRCGEQAIRTTSRGSASLSVLTYPDVHREDGGDPAEVTTT